MSVRARRFTSWFLLVASLVVVGSGCRSEPRLNCTPKGLWQSPILQATRAHLVLPEEELHILRIDGKNAHALRSSPSRTKEFFLPGGEHSITASFRYSAHVPGGVVGEVRGMPLTIEHDFVVGHEYEAVYHESVGPKRTAKWWLEGIVIDIFRPQELYWSLEIIDRTESAK